MSIVRGGLVTVLAAVVMVRGCGGSGDPSILLDGEGMHVDGADWFAPGHSPGRIDGLPRPDVLAAMALTGRPVVGPVRVVLAPGARAGDLATVVSAFDAGVVARADHDDRWVEVIVDRDGEPLASDHRLDAAVARAAEVGVLRYRLRAIGMGGFAGAMMRRPPAEVIVTASVSADRVELDLDPMLSRLPPAPLPGRVTIPIDDRTEERIGRWASVPAGWARLTGAAPPTVSTIVAAADDARFDVVSAVVRSRTHRVPLGEVELVACGRSFPFGRSSGPVLVTFGDGVAELRVREAGGDRVETLPCLSEGCAYDGPSIREAARQLAEGPVRLAAPGHTMAEVCPLLRDLAPGSLDAR